MIKQNLEKLYIIMKCDKQDYNSYINNINQENILKQQLECYKNNNYIYVINTILLWGIDYFGKEKYDEYNKVVL